MRFHIAIRDYDTRFHITCQGEKMVFWKKKLKKLVYGKVLKEEAEKMRIPYSSFHQMVYGGVKNPNIGYLRKIANYYGITMDELLGNKQTGMTEKESEVELAKAWIRKFGKKWFTRERLEDLSNEDIIALRNYIEVVQARRKAEKRD